MKKSKPLKIFSGNFEEFVNHVFGLQKPDNTVFSIGNIKDAIRNDLANNGIELLANLIVISDKKLLRAVRDSKIAKGKSIAPERLHEIVEAIENPLAILKDKRGGQLVYIYAKWYENDLMLKVIVEPNYNIEGNFVNLAKSIGFVQAANLNDKAIYEIVFGKT